MDKFLKMASPKFHSHRIKTVDKKKTFTNMCRKWDNKSQELTDYSLISVNMSIVIDMPLMYNF